MEDHDPDPASDSDPHSSDHSDDAASDAASDADAADDPDADGTSLSPLPAAPLTPSSLDSQPAADAHRSRSRSTSKEPADIRPRPKLRDGAATAYTYDIVPYVAAPQSTSINAFCATPCMRWIFTGGSDGYIRRFNWFESINGRVALTVAQRHPFVDSVTRVGPPRVQRKSCADIG